MTIGRLDRIPVTNVWPNEATDFTPWLEENLDQLGDVLKLKLEPNGREVKVGNYALDLLAIDSNSGKLVAIENQTNDTDHKHLGQALTYAAGLEAGIIVWIATEFGDEHRAAIDWLNKVTTDEVDFFGVKVSAVRIGDSQPAAQFTMAAAPNHWSQRLKGPQNPSNKREGQYQNFWEPLLSKLKQQSGWTIKTENRKSRYDAGSGLSPGFTKTTLNLAPATFGRTMRFTNSGEARVEWNIMSENPEWNKEMLAKLMQLRPDIEAGLGELLWEPLDDAKISRLVARRPGSIEHVEEDLEDIRNWMLEKMTAFPTVMARALPKVLAEDEAFEEQTLSQ